MMLSKILLSTRQAVYMPQGGGGGSNFSWHVESFQHQRKGRSAERRIDYGCLCYLPLSTTSR